VSQLKQVRRIYDRDPEMYHRGMSSRITNWMLAGRREKVGEMVRGRLLDIGIGTGLSLPHYPPAVEVVGIDYSRPMLRHAMRLMGGERAELVQADAEQLPFASNSFDSVAFSLCLCTIPDPERAIREAVRVARPGAPMIFLEHVRSHLFPVALVQDVINPLTVLTGADHFNRRTADAVSRGGVQIERVERWFLGMFNLIVGRASGKGP
jgi:ubiquinone/menaquinone biosynthesis C-methylase UbiE